MATRISALLRAPEQARAMGALGRRVVRQKFSCEAQLERTQDLYDELLYSAANGVGSAPREVSAQVNPWEPSGC